jgi:hypothetical protein
VGKGHLDVVDLVIVIVRFIVEGKVDGAEVGSRRASVDGWYEGL